MSVLDLAAVDAVDSTGQLADIVDLPNQLRDALWRVESAALEPQDSPGGVVIAGMGGSAIGGYLARAALGDRASRPLVISRDYGLPAWTTPDTTVLCASYSGDTEETLAAYEAAGALGARQVVATTGGALAEAARADGVPVIPMPAGLQPRAAVAYLTVAALEVASLSGAGPGLRAEVDVAAAHSEQLISDWAPDGPEDSAPKELARALADSIPVMVGAGLTAPVAYRWKTQFNENAKLPAFSGELPEIDHNEIEGWAGAADTGGRFAAVFLDDCDLHPRVQERIALTRELVSPHAASTHVVEAHGDTRTERAMGLVLFGDLVSLYVAVLRGVDPGPVQILDRVKNELSARV